MKVLAFAGSNSRQSINKALLEYTLSLIENVEVELVDLNDYEMPIYSVERNQEGIPTEAKEFKKKLDEADAIICSLAEHNGAFSTAFKNIYDWVSRIDMNVFGQKPMLLMSTSPGQRGGASVLNLAAETFPWFGANIVAKYSLPNFCETFDLTKKSIIDTQADQQLREQINLWKQATA